jgi:hypothetical protein
MRWMDDERCLDFPDITDHGELGCAAPIVPYELRHV